MTTFGDSCSRSCRLAVVLSSALLLGSGCGGSGSTSSGSGPEPVTLPLGRISDDVELRAGETWQRRLVYNSSAVALWTSLTPLTAVTMDLAASLESVTVTPLAPRKEKPAGGPASSQAGAEAMMTARIAPADQEANVCQNGELFGPFNVRLDESMRPEQVDPPTATATQSALSIINTGAFAVCLEVVSTMDMRVEAGDIVAVPETCHTPPADISGVWTGTYSCTGDPCSDDEDDHDITLTVTQRENGYSAHYEDSEASYGGTVCGNEFRFNGRGPGYTESGVFTLVSPTTAVKESQWHNDDGPCGGRCRDTLRRQ